MGRSVDGRKWAAWRRRLERFERSHVSVARFCRAEGVSTASFYQWRRKITASTADAAGAVSSPDEKAFAAVRLVGSVALVAELSGGTRLRVPTGDVGLMRAAIDQIVSADGRLSRGDGRC